MESVTVVVLPGRHCRYRRQEHRYRCGLFTSPSITRFAKEIVSSVTPVCFVYINKFRAMDSNRAQW